MNPRGEAHYAAKLTEQAVRAIRARAMRGDTLAAICEQFPQVSKVAVHFAITGRTWKHLDAQPRAPRRIKLDAVSTISLRTELERRGFTVILA